MSPPFEKATEPLESLARFSQPQKVLFRISKYPQLLSRSEGNYVIISHVGSFCGFLSVVILPHPTTCFSTTGARRVLLRAGRRRGDFLGGVVRRGSRDSLYLSLVSAEAKAARSVHLGKAAPAGSSKMSERATDRTEAVSLSN